MLDEAFWKDLFGRFSGCFDQNLDSSWPVFQQYVHAFAVDAVEVLDAGALALLADGFEVLVAATAGEASSLPYELLHDEAADK